MNIDRFRHLAEAFGGDLSRWPPLEQKAAAVLLRADPAARRIVADEQALDALLRHAGGDMDADISARAEQVQALISARIDAAPRRSAGLFSRAASGNNANRTSWAAAGFLAVMAVAGALTGAAVGPSIPSARVAADDGLLNASDYYSTRYIVSMAQ